MAKWTGVEMGYGGGKSWISEKASYRIRVKGNKDIVIVLWVKCQSK